MSRARTRLERVPAPIWVAAAVALAVLAGVAALLLGMRDHATVYFRGDYESGGLSQWRGPQLTAGARADAEAPTVRQGRYAAVFTTRASKTRARSQVFVGQAETDGYEGQEVWYAWSTMVARGSVLAADTAWNNLTAWHQTGTRCPAPDHFRIDTSSGVWRLELDAWGGPLDERRCSNP